MQKQYETVIINSSLLTDSQIKESIKKYRDLIKKKGKVIHEEDWGLRKLAYPIKKKSSGYYFLFEYNATPEFIQQLEKEFNRDDKILRYLSVTLDRYAIEYNEKKRKSGKRSLKSEEESKDLLNV